MLPGVNDTVANPSASVCADDSREKFCPSAGSTPENDIDCPESGAFVHPLLTWTLRPTGVLTIAVSPVDEAAFIFPAATQKDMLRDPLNDSLFAVQFHLDTAEPLARILSIK